jgi:glutamate--cysteine ligase
MTDRLVRTRTPIQSIDELAQRFHAGAKPPGELRIGAEHEKIGVLIGDGPDLGAAVPFDGPRGIEALLGRLAGRGFGRVVERGRTVALSRPPEKLTLEPGGQLEHSADPLSSIAAIEDELTGQVRELVDASAPLGIAWLGIGFRPWGTRDEVTWVPKGRYEIMRLELPERGALALDMMKRTATVQANLDYTDEDDAGRKLRAAMSVTSLVTALFASSPIASGRDTGHASYRARVWLETDPARCGLLPFAFEEGAIFRRYTEWALDVPLLFLYRDERYLRAGGVTFRRFLREGLAGERATLEDWDTHLTTLFPEVRLKHYLEVRGADAGPMAIVTALPALWKGILYEEGALDAATALLAGLSYADRLALREAVPVRGLAAPLPDGRTVRDAARELVAIARAGLSRLAPDEVRYLAPLEEIAATGRTIADRVRELFASAGDDRRAIIEGLRLG